MDILDNFIEKAKESIAEGYYDVQAIRHREAGTVRGRVSGVGRQESETARHQVSGVGHRAAGFGRASLKDKLLGGFSLIAEIKHASPAGEYSFDNIDVAETAETFKQYGADAISVVVEPKIFKGNLNNISIAKKTGLPVLFKDFIIKEQQIEAARAVGADAILLVIKVADRCNLDLDALIGFAHKQGLEVVLESYDANEMKRAMATDADIIGINNRDLRTLKVDLNRTKDIMTADARNQKPVISESGIKTAADVRFVRKAGVNGILVGTAIWTAPDLKAKIKELKNGAKND